MGFFSEVCLGQESSMASQRLELHPIQTPPLGLAPPLQSIFMALKQRLKELEDASTLEKQRDDSDVIDGPWSLQKSQPSVDKRVRITLGPKHLVDIADPSSLDKTNCRGCDLVSKILASHFVDNAREKRQGRNDHGWLIAYG